MALFQLVRWCLPPGGHGYTVAAGAVYGTVTRASMYIIQIDTRWHLYKACRSGSKPLYGGNCGLCSFLTPLLAMLDGLIAVLAPVAAFVCLVMYFVDKRKEGNLLGIAIAMFIVFVLEIVALRWCHSDGDFDPNLAYYLPSKAVDSAKAPGMSWSSLGQKMYYGGRLLQAVDSDGKVLPSKSTGATNAV